jgi:phospholipid/cholesterol/gamma-HCH transport system ATP-binding protein
MSDCAAFVLVGGKSSRMGADKAFLTLQGQTLLDRALGLAHSVSDDVRIVTSRASPDNEKFAAYGPVVEDVYKDSGPLSGIHAALSANCHDFNLILAVDIPFISHDLLQYIGAEARASQAMVTVPRVGGRFQPLCAVYSRDFAPVAERALNEGLNKIDTLFPHIPMRIIDEEELARFGFSPSLFDNLNTREDLQQARQRVGEKGDTILETLPPVGTQDQSSPPPSDPSRPYIDFKHVFKAFGSNRVLDDVSFNVMPAETVCILGRSGVGKSVALHHIMGFLKPDAGRIVVAFEDITDYGEEDLQRIRKKVTMVFQNGALFDSLTVGENVAFPLRERADLTEEQIFQVVDGLLEMVGVKPMRDLLPSDLSTGMKRSVAIARALAAQPECVLYDEPTTMVDPLMAQLLGDLIKKLKFQLKLTSVVVTHDMHLAKKLADRVVFLHEGKVLFFGTMQEMAASEEPIIQQFLRLDELRLDEGPPPPATGSDAQLPSP